MMENRSFDHFLGWLPGADGHQAGLVFADGTGVAHSTYHLSEFQGCGYADPDHSWDGGRVEYDNGACDGWLRAGANDEFAIGYYTAADLAFYGKAAPYWTVCDRYFSAIMAETYPNRMYLHAAQTDRLHNDEGPTIATLPTIWDRLQAAGRTGRYYFSDAPFTALWGTKYLPISEPIADFFAASPGRCPTSRTSTRGSSTRDRDRPATIIRTPTSASASTSSPRSTTRSPRARPGRGRCSSSRTTSGAASTTTCRRRSRPTQPEPACVGSAFPASWSRHALGASTSRTTSTTTRRS